MILKLVTLHWILLATSGTQNNVPLCELPYLFLSLSGVTISQVNWKKNNGYVYYYSKVLFHVIIFHNINQSARKYNYSKKKWALQNPWPQHCCHSSKSQHWFLWWSITHLLTLPKGTIIQLTLTIKKKCQYSWD